MSVSSAVSSVVFAAGDDGKKLCRFLSPFLHFAPEQLYCSGGGQHGVSRCSFH